MDEDRLIVIFNPELYVHVIDLLHMQECTYMKLRIGFYRMIFWYIAYIKIVDTF